MTVWIAVRTSVFLTALRNSGSPLKMMLKFSTPDQRLWPTPRYGWKSWKAMTLPQSG